MRKLTKTINKRRKNYKPTIGLTFKGGRLSVNATEYYIERDKREVAKAEREIKRKMRSMIREALPNLAFVMDYFGGFLEKEYGCNPYEAY